MTKKTVRHVPRHRLPWTGATRHFDQFHSGLCCGRHLPDPLRQQRQAELFMQLQTGRQ